jgi:hypothetical protein
MANMLSISIIGVDIEFVVLNVLCFCGFNTREAGCLEGIICPTHGIYSPQDSICKIFAHLVNPSCNFLSIVVKFCLN